MHKSLVQSPHKCSTIVELLRWRSSCQPDRRAYTFLTFPIEEEVKETHLTYGELDRQARAIGALLQDLKAAGERVLLLYPSGLEYVAALFGCFYAGAIAVPSYPPRLNRSDLRLQAIVADAQATIVLTNAQILSNLERRFTHTPELKSLHWLATDNLNPIEAENWQEPILQGNTLAFLQYTSGSTAAPKGVMVSHSNLLHNLCQIQQCFETTEDTQGMFWLPFYHDMGLMGGVLEIIFCGGTNILMSPIDFLQQPLRWLATLSRAKATISGGPNSAYELCAQKITPEQKLNLDLSNWEFAFCGAEPIRPETFQHFNAAFEPYGFRAEAFYPCYGLAEATVMVSGGLKSVPPVLCAVQGTALQNNQVLVANEEDDARILVGCGQTVPDQKIVIVDPKTQTLSQSGQVGEVWVSGPNVAQGYWHNPQETEHTFQAYLVDTGEGPFLRTGDLGFLQDNASYPGGEGELFIAGRLKDLIIIRGRNHYPQDIELTMEQSHPALQPNGGAAFSVEIEGEERLVVVQEVQRSYRNVEVEEVIQVIQGTITEIHELQVYSVILIRPMSIPKTSSGKIQRSLCRKQFLEGSLQVLGQWSRNLEADSHPLMIKTYTPPSNETEKKLAEIWQQVLKLERVGIHDSFFELGGDSLLAAQILSRVREIFDMDFQLDKLFQQPTVAAMANYIETVHWVAQNQSAPKQESGREKIRL